MDKVEQNSIFRNCVSREFAFVVEEFGFDGPIEEDWPGFVDISMDYWNDKLVVSIYIDKMGTALLLSFSRNLQQSGVEAKYRSDPESYIEVSEVLDLIGVDGRLSQRERWRSAFTKSDIEAEVSWCAKQARLLLPLLTEYFEQIHRKVRQMR